MSDNLRIQELEDDVQAANARIGELIKECNTQLERVQVLEADKARLEAALAFYADRETWKGRFPERPIDKDCDGDFAAVQGKRARAALSGSPDHEDRSLENDGELPQGGGRKGRVMDEPGTVGWEEARAERAEQRVEELLADKARLEAALDQARKFRLLAGVGFGCLDLMDEMLDDPEGFAREIERRNDQTFKALVAAARSPDPSLKEAVFQAAMAYFLDDKLRGAWLAACDAYAKEEGDG